MKTCKIITLMAVAMTAVSMTGCIGRNYSQEKLKKMTESKYVWSVYDQDFPGQRLYYSYRNNKPCDFIVRQDSNEYFAKPRHHYWYLGRNMKEAYYSITEAKKGSLKDENFRILEYEFCGTKWTKTEPIGDNFEECDVWYTFIDENGAEYIQMYLPNDFIYPFDDLEHLLEFMTDTFPVKMMAEGIWK